MYCMSMNVFVCVCVSAWDGVTDYHHGKSDMLTSHKMSSFTVDFAISKSYMSTRFNPSNDRGKLINTCRLNMKSHWEDFRVLSMVFNHLGCFHTCYVG